MVTFAPSPQQQQFFDWIVKGSGSCILEAVAGSGKTTTLLHGIERMRGSIFVGMFNKKIADEFKLKAPQRTDLNIGTMHSAGLRIWGRVAGRGLKIDSNKMRDLFRVSYKDTPMSFFESQVLDLVSYAKQSAFGVVCSAEDTALWNGLIDHFDVECTDEKGKDASGQIVETAQALLAKSVEADKVIIDFDDMIYAPLIHKCRAFEHDWVLIDEAQDTNSARRALALLLLKRGGRLVAVGDRHQAIYGFTGADANALDLIAQAVSAEQLPLTVTYRCPKAVVAHAQQWVKHITAHESAPEGAVRDAQKPLLEETQAGDVVLCRFNAPLIESAYAFIAAGKPAKVEGRDIGRNLKSVLSRFRARSYDALLSKLEQWRDREVAKYRMKEQESRAAAVEDKARCCEILIERTMKIAPAVSNPVGAVCEEIDKIFTDNANGGSVVFSTIHKAKGREWDRVFWMQTGPSKWARKDWEKAQEVNLCYVASTRAKKELVLVG